MSKQQNEFSQHWKQKQITERKMTERQKLLLEIERLNKEIIKLKEVIENKNAHVESKNKHIARLEKVISIMKKGEPTIFDFSRRERTLPLSPIGAFLPCKNCLSRGNHVEFSSVSLS